MGDQRNLFDALPPGQSRGAQIKPKPIQAHLWTAQKAALIAEYLHRFLIVTSGGVYIDLFAGPQEECYAENWSIRRVIERRSTGPTFRHYAACDHDRKQISLLHQLREAHCSRGFVFKVYEGNANKKIHNILGEAPIGPKTPCFCLIDQRTLECEWETVRAVARYKEAGLKIEIFYFLAQGWLDRSWRSTMNFYRLARWWGRNDYRRFLELKSVDRAHVLCERFRDELGYQYAQPWSIHEKGSGGRTMYYMIHSSDHPRACALMSEAYDDARYLGCGGIRQIDAFPRLPPT